MWLVGFVQMYVKSALVTLGCAVLLHVPDHKSCVELILFFFLAQVHDFSQESEVSMGLFPG